MHEVTKALMDKGELGLALTSAASFGDIEACSLILAKGADVNWSALQQVPALHWAAQYGYVEVAQLLIAAGADVNKQTEDGARALTWAIVCLVGEDIVRVLLEAGADPNFATRSWSSPLSRAIAAREISIVRLLVKYGASISFIADDAPAGTLSPLQFAVTSNELAIVQYFISACEEGFDQVASDGRTLVDLANGRAEMTTLLRSLETDAAVRRGLEASSHETPVRVKSTLGSGPL
jgi:ankyrin repeat protein